MLIPILIVAALVIVILALSLRTVAQGTVAVTTVFGKYQRMLRPGLNFLIPFVERIFRRISIQNRSVELQFQAITQDQANVYFSAMMVYSDVRRPGGDDQERRVQVRHREGLPDCARPLASRESTRGYVAVEAPGRDPRSAPARSSRRSRSSSTPSLEGWGYHLIDVQLNDITFDQVITQSMAQVVASNNLKAAATNEGDAMLIRRTKEAEADGTAVRIEAEAERTAAQLRGQGVALFREEVARGLAQAAREMEQNQMDNTLILFSMWTESIRHVAENGRGNVLFLDGSPQGMEKQMRDLMALQTLQMEGLAPPPPAQPG